MPSYDKGDMVRLTATFRDITGAVIDPTTVQLTAVQPDKTLYTRSYGQALPNDQLKKSGVGVYYIDFYVGQGGRYGYQWTGDGLAAAVAEGGFYARDEVIASGN